MSPEAPSSMLSQLGHCRHSVAGVSATQMATRRRQLALFDPQIVADVLEWTTRAAKGG